MPRARLETQGFGESHPVAPNRTRAGRAKNRRVEFVAIAKYAGHRRRRSRSPGAPARRRRSRRRAPTCALACGGGPMIDAADDTPNATGALDLVGTNAVPRRAFTPPTRSSSTCACASRPTPLGSGNARRLTPGASSSISTAIARPTRCSSRRAASAATTRSRSIAIRRRRRSTIRPIPRSTPAAFTYPFATHGRVSAAGIDARRRRRRLPRSRGAVERSRHRRHRARHAGLRLGRLVDGAERARPRSRLLRRRRRPLERHRRRSHHARSERRRRRHRRHRRWRRGRHWRHRRARTLEGGLGCALSPLGAALPSLFLLLVVVAAIGVRRYFRSSR